VKAELYQQGVGQETPGAKEGPPKKELPARPPPHEDQPQQDDGWTTVRKR